MVCGKCTVGSKYGCCEKYGVRSAVSKAVVSMICDHDCKVGTMYVLIGALEL